MSTVRSASAPAARSAGSAVTVPDTLSHTVLVSWMLERALTTTRLPAPSMWKTGTPLRRALQEQRCDVVGAAVAVGLVDQLGDRPLERLGVLHDPADRL